MEFIKDAPWSVCSRVSSATKRVFSSVIPGDDISKKLKNGLVHSCCQKVIRRSVQSDLWGVYHGASCKNLIRLAGFSGSCAIVLATYGSHMLSEDSRANERRKRAFEVASKHHVIYSLALLMSHKSHYPLLTAVLFFSGMLFVCVPKYSYGIWNEELKAKHLMTLGSVSLLLGWLSFGL